MTVRPTEAIRDQVRTLATSMNTGVRETEALRQKVASQRAQVRDPAKAAQLDALQRRVEQLSHDGEQLQRDFMKGLEQFAAAARAAPQPPAPKISPQQAAALWRAAASGTAVASQHERRVEGVNPIQQAARLVALAVVITALAAVIRYLF